MRLIRSSLVLFGLACAGCGAADGRDPDSLDDPPPLSLVEELRIGSVDDPNLGFTRVAEKLEVTRGDTIYLAETSVPEIRVYTSDGRVARRFGRLGDGPGELNGIFSWGVQGDTVWVIGGFPARVTLFRRDGSLLGTIPNVSVQIRSGNVVATVAARELLPGGTLRGALMSYSLPRDGPPVTLQVPELLFGPDGVVKDTLGHRELTVTPVAALEAEMVGELRIPRSRPLSSEPLLVMAGSDSVRVLRPAAEAPGPATITVARVTVQGDTLFRRDFSYTPHPVPASFVDSVTQARIDSYRNRTSDLGGMTRAVRTMTEFPSYFPPVAQATVAKDGSIWLRRQPAQSDGWRWLLLAPDGALRGEVHTSANAVVLWHEGDVVYLMEPDDLEVPWVVKYRLEGGR